MKKIISLIAGIAAEMFLAGSLIVIGLLVSAAIRGV